MESTITAPTAEQLTAIAISAIVAKAVVDAHGAENKWPFYNLAKREITKVVNSEDEYRQAIKLLTEALNI